MLAVDVEPRLDKDFMVSRTISVLSFDRLPADLHHGLLHDVVAVLASSTNGEHEGDGGLLLDVVVRDRVAIFELVVVEEQALLVFRNALLVLDDDLEDTDGVRCLDIHRDGLATNLREDLHVARVVAGVVVVGVAVVGVVVVGVATLVVGVVVTELLLVLGVGVDLRLRIDHLLVELHVLVVVVLALALALALALELATNQTITVPGDDLINNSNMNNNY